MAEAFDVTVRCSVCGGQAARVQVLPCNSEALRAAPKGTPGQGSRSTWRFVYEGVEAGTGPHGNAVTPTEAERLRTAFTVPLTYDAVHTAGLYDDAGFCQMCQRPYCFEHWGAGEGSGTCPRGHWRSLDPHWYPAF